MEIKVLGTGCPKCQQLEEMVKKTIQELGIEASVIKVDDIQKIISYGVIRTPALVINEHVVLSGRLPSVEELKKLIDAHKS